jgi:hypothetical protein
LSSNGDPCAKRRSASYDEPFSFLTRFAWLFVAAAILTIGLKAVADLLTGSVGLL